MKRPFGHSSSIQATNLLNELKDDFEGLSLKKAIIRLAIDRLNGEPQIIFARIDFFRDDELTQEHVTYDYEELVLTKFLLESDKVSALMKNLINGESINVESIGNVKCSFESQSWNCQVKISNTHLWYVKQNFPFLVYTGKISDLNNRNPYGLIAKKDLPPFSNRSKAIMDFLDLYSRDPYTSLLNQNQFVIVMPDYRARIKKMKIGKNRITLEIESKYIDEKDILVQYNIDGRKETKIRVDNHRAEIDFVTSPKQILAVMMEKSTGEVLDYIDYTPSWTESEDSIEYEIPEGVVRNWIDGGENERVEFKSVLDHADDVAKSIVSFANTEGGVILVGVDDSGRIIGYNEPLEKTKTRVQNMIANKCDPPVGFKAEVVDLGEKITVITIPKGDARIYSVTNGGMYLRRGGTDTFIKPSELESRFANNKSQTRSAF